VGVKICIRIIDIRFIVLLITVYKEIYIGVAKDVDSRILKHAGYYTGGAKTIAHWDFESDYIKRYVYPDRFNSKNRASQTAHYLEDVCNIPNGYEVFLTCGI
jgi:predicted GIY-YIG superfamily endonuclease